MKNILIFTLINFCFSQVNIENLRNDSLSNKLINKLSFNLSIEKTDVEVADFETNYRFDYNINPKLKILFISNYKNGYKKTPNNKNKIINKGFCHLRSIYKTSQVIMFEAFSQYEFNDFLLINNRQLIGSGIRFKSESIKNILIYIGNGFMYEIEKYDYTSFDTYELESNLFRSTNYFTLNGTLTENILFQNTFYLQPNLSNFNDFRFLYDAELKINLKTNITFVASLNFRYDSDPHEGSTKKYLIYNNGISLKF